MTEWIAIVDDDALNLRTASMILSKNHMRITALHSGQTLLDWIAEENTPDLILLDIMMPDMDGFETLKKLREFEEKTAAPQIPVIFLTGDSDAEVETRCLSAGALDFIRKPFEANALVHRVRNVVSQTARMRELAIDSAMDRMTGFYNKTVATEKIRELCAQDQGALLIADLDSFKLVNDIYGHDMGDRILLSFASAVKSHIGPDDVVGRIGGDEFLFFCKSITTEEEMLSFIRTLNSDLMKQARELMGEHMKVPLGVSAGGIFVPHKDLGYADLFQLADRALYIVKQKEKHDCMVADSLDPDHMGAEPQSDIRSLRLSMAERDERSHAMWIGEDAFREIYRFLMRYIQSYHGVAYQVLFTLNPPRNAMDDAQLMSVCYEFGHILQNTLRKSDIMMQNSTNQFFLLLPELEEKYVDSVMGRIARIWEQNPNAKDVGFVYELQIVEPEADSENRRRDDSEA